MPSSHEYSLWVRFKGVWVHATQTPYLSSILQKLSLWAAWKERRGHPGGLRDWEIGEDSFWGKWCKVQKSKGHAEGKWNWKKRGSKKRDLSTMVWLQANWLLFVILSRWGPTLATQWQPPTSTTTGEWTERHRWWQKKKLKWARERNWRSEVRGHRNIRQHWDFLEVVSPYVTL